VSSTSRVHILRFVTVFVLLDLFSVHILCPKVCHVSLSAARRTYYVDPCVKRKRGGNTLDLSYVPVMSSLNVWI